MFRFILVLMQSLSGSGHNFAVRRPRLADKLELFRFDPWGIFLECCFLCSCLHSEPLQWLCFSIRKVV